ncbi:MAG: metallophosphoesterase, partial [Gammaproteobacteria bacterium]|nr:metallophosphoesterase [Gammaproteobacteria bacterium]
MKSCLRLIQISDLHFGFPPGDLLNSGINTVQTFAQVAQRIAQLQPDAIVATGDLAQDPEAEVYQRLAATFARLPAPVYCLPGNHDDPELMAQILTNPPSQPNAQNSPCKQVLLGGWQLLLLDSNHRQHSHRGRLGDAELAWLEQSLAAQPALHSLICLHHHPQPIHSPWMDRMGLEDSAELLRLLQRHPQVRGVIFGHIHQDFSL